ncbi:MULTISPECIES: DUF1285 domain-containing protein [unclassified Psychrobacter]|uniref:DUF1285 domain-containing protein n=1 Tax=unclassified Psychrobacter TaxID=196806 RepID=UPI0008335744|nr:DUF1285 domain-containing protein [Psychrobacter sp. P2G3]
MSSNINDGVETGNLASSSIADNVNNSGTTQDLSNLDSLSNYLKSSAGTRQGRSIPPLDEWHPEQVADMDLVIKANGEWWHEGGLVTRQSLVSLFATILWKEESNGTCEYFLKTPVQKLRIQVEDVPLLINDVGIVTENGVSWLEFTTTTGDVVRLDNEHPIELRSYKPTVAQEDIAKEQVRPYMLVRNDLTALIGRNTFYHLTEIGKLTEQNDEVILTLESGGKSYQLLMPDS